MARTFSGALVPAVSADGSIQWQGWQYEELLAHLTNDLILDNFTPPSSLSWTPQWITPSLTSGWTTRANDPAGYLKDPLGFVHLRGRFATTGTSGTSAFTLPSGYRPQNTDDLYAAAGYNGTVSAVAAWADIFSSSGTVNLFYATGATDVGIGSISFLAEL